MSDAPVRDGGSVRNQQIAVTAFLAILGGGVAIGSVSYGLGTLAKPGSGLVPFLIGLSMVLLASALLVRDIRTGRAVPEELDIPEGHHESVDGQGPADITPRLNGVWSLLVCAVLFSFVIFTTEPLGLLVTAAITVAVIAYLMRTSWWASALVGVGFYALGYLVFAIWLEIPLPFGTVSGG